MQRVIYAGTERAAVELISALEVILGDSVEVCKSAAPTPEELLSADTIVAQSPTRELMETARALRRPLWADMSLLLERKDVRSTLSSREGMCG